MAEITAALLAKAKTLSPMAAVLLMGISGGWYARGQDTRMTKAEARIAVVDSASVKRHEFERVVDRLEAVASRQDSTNALLRRFICRSQPVVCP